ncbi:S1C family serine protease [Conexibacter arvalis]|uniref:Putative serine protease PepD n=1 Tax=Conexibacter arvalis TaxID=912552 RepID=A0A840IIK8_9ACTN|nr:trypsin-like peptidase domain-containing protein [Conexibacter arvalis]MBB4664051.1 putative serine protease PepD [Conexibacter arvalis]
MRTPRAIVTLAAAAVLGAAGGAAVVGVTGDGGSTRTVLEPAQTQPQQVSVADSSGGLSAKQVYDLAKDSVVFISAHVTEQGQSGEATGSGFVVSRDGYIVTNAHVVGGASTVSVKIGDRKTQQAEVVGTDESTDIALLKVDGAGDLKPLQLGDSSKLEVGDATFAIGNPFGLDRTLTTGVVSALDRHITAPNGFSIDGVVQTDAPINPGNSGGPLLDAQGKVIGVNSQILTGSSTSEGNVGIGFAAPSNTVRNVVEQLREHGSVKHAYLGVQMGATESGSGALVGAVTPGGPAADAGLRAGDVIVAFDGHAVGSPDALSSLVNAKQVGDSVELTVRRGGAEQKLTVTLGEQPASTATAGAQPQQQGDPQMPADPFGQADPHGQQSDPYGQGGGQQADPGQGQGGQQQIDPRDLLEQLIP